MPNVFLLQLMARCIVKETAYKAPFRLIFLTIHAHHTTELHI